MTAPFSGVRPASDRGRIVTVDCFDGDDELRIEITCAGGEDWVYLSRDEVRQIRDLLTSALECEDHT